jgi:hypothetical protein
MQRDIKILTEIYNQRVLNEDPDSYPLQRGGVNLPPLHYTDKKAVPFFKWKDTFVFAKVFGTAHNALFSKAIINAYVGLPLDTSKNEMSKSGLSWDNANFNPDASFIKDLVANDGIKDVTKLNDILSPQYRDRKKNLVTFQEFWTTAIADVGNVINTLKLRGYLTPCGRAWIAPEEDPNTVFITFWPGLGGTKISGADKEKTKKAIADLIKKFPAAFSIRPGYVFEIEGGEEAFDSGKIHAEIDPKKRREQMIAKGIKTGSSKEAEIASKAGFNTAAGYKDVRRQGLGDSFNH